MGGDFEVKTLGVRNMDGTCGWLLTCFFLTCGSVRSLSLQTTVIAYMQQTSQNHRCVWVGDTEGFPKNIPMFAMTSTHMLFFAICIAEVSTVKRKFEMRKFKSDLPSQQSQAPWKSRITHVMAGNSLSKG